MTTIYGELDQILSDYYCTGMSNEDAIKKIMKVFEEYKDE